jgi:hypothetical protein
MSRIYFHSQEGAVEVKGVERAWFGLLAGRFSLGILGLDYWSDGAESPHPIRAFLRPESYLNHSSYQGTGFVRALETALQVGFDRSLVVHGEPLDCFLMHLNTLMAVGNDPLRLAARLHGQCEIHAWVAGANRDWLAGIVLEGLRRGVFRPRMGWEEVVAFLRLNAALPVVTSYSVCEQFPNQSVGMRGGFVRPTAVDEETGEAVPDYDAWYELPLGRQWAYALAGLSDEPSLEMRPDDWVDYHFGENFTALSLLRLLQK